MIKWNENKVIRIKTKIIITTITIIMIIKVIITR